MLTVIITIFAIVVSFPIGLVLALGRRSQIRGVPAWLTYGAALVIAIWGFTQSTPDLIAAARNDIELALAYWPILVLVLAYAFQRTFNGNVLAAFSTLYIEFVRGVPLITVLFGAKILFPILLPPRTEILDTWRILWAFALFSAAYLAENVRGGLQAIPKGQYEAADSLGFSAYQKYRLIILPQALRVVIPAIVGQFIGLFKDTSLVAIVGLFDVLGVANAIAAQEDWLGVRREPYIFLAVLYFIGSAIMTAYSRYLEKRTGLGER
ncbi:MAG: amino acid ABC transporter permease [Anaerolineaceae bacterium]|nr:amino acid ABC transporter permease [Anaerolineaceae bacterium]